MALPVFRRTNRLIGVSAKNKERDTAVGFSVEGMPRQITQLPNLFGFLVSQLGLIQLVGKLFQRSKERLFRVVLAMVASGSLAQAASSVTLEWDPSPHTDVVGYIVFSGIVGTSYLSPLDVGDQTSVTLTKLFGGITNFFFVRAYNTHG